MELGDPEASFVESTSAKKSKSINLMNLFKKSFLFFVIDARSTTSTLVSRQKVIFIEKA